jgi:hypothetical protein
MCRARWFILNTPYISYKDIGKRDKTLLYLLNAFATQSISAFGQLYTIL